MSGLTRIFGPDSGLEMSLLLGATADPVVRLTPQARIIAAVLALVFVGLILDLIRRDRLLERYSIVWFLLGLAMLVGAAFPGLLELLARAMGVRDVTIALFSVVLLTLLGLSLNFSVIASRQAKQITRLAQQSAIESVRPPDPTEPPKLTVPARESSQTREG
ncbi:MAG: DUF2304 domain-containing protein [Actinomycetota bacterium]|nr:DUF2304 domain-containing protein [Actinomycetota bacterium]